jgi:transposase
MTVKKKLTTRQQQVHDLLVVDHLTPAQVAKRLRVTPNGIYMMIRRLRLKGHPVPIGDDTGQKKRGPGRPRKLTGSVATAAANQDGKPPLVAKILGSVRHDAEKLEEAMSSNRRERQEAAAKVEQLDLEHAQMEQVHTGLVAVK